MPPSGTTKSRAWLWILIAVAIILLFIFIPPLFRSEITVRTARVSHQDLRDSVSTNGKVEPIQDFQAHAPMPGVVEKLFVHLGEIVHKDQPLVTMDASDAASKVASAQASLVSSTAALQNMQHGGSQQERLSQEADMQAATTQLQQAQTSLASLQQLQAKGAASANEVALAQEHVQTAQTRIAQLKQQQTGRYAPLDLNAQRAQVSEARAALNAARSDYASVDIRAPFGGTVYALPVAQYDFVQAGEALLNIADLNHLRVRAYFDEPEIGKLAVGQPVTIVWDARPGRVWHGHIEQAPTTIITYGTRNVGECLITVDDANGDLLPNTTVTVTATTMQLHNVLSLPREALHTEGASDFVYRISGDHLVRTPVQVGVVSLTRVQILSGLNDGDPVALAATTDVDLSNGLKVKTTEQ